jgi:hypothetical protein
VVVSNCQEFNSMNDLLINSNMVLKNLTNLLKFVFELNTDAKDLIEGFNHHFFLLLPT